MAVGAALHAAFDWSPAVWIVICGMAGLAVFGALWQFGVISLARYESDDETTRRD